MGRHMNIQVRSALVSAVLNKSFTVDTGIALKDGMGKLMNLVSVDIGVSLSVDMVGIAHGFCYHVLIKHLWSKSTHRQCSPYYVYCIT